MDLMAQRYADPYMILDDFIRLNQLHDFSIETMKTIAEEKKHEARWNYYLHRVWDMSFEDYVNACEQEQQKRKEMSHEEIEDVINNSKNMLEGFIPS